jgi:hypothetical protein
MDGSPESGNREIRYLHQCRRIFASMMLSNVRISMWLGYQIGHIGLMMVNEVYGKWFVNK